MSFYTRKDNQTYREGQMPLHYPADRVYLDGDTSKTVQDAISDFDVLWTGDAHTLYDVINLSHPVTDYKKIMFVFNVIPSRTPSHDVPADQVWYPAIQTDSYWDVCAFGANIKAFTLLINTTTNATLTVMRYLNVETSEYATGLVKVIGFKCN